MHKHSRYGADERNLFPDVGSLDGAEEEHPVFLDRPAQLATVLVPLETQRTGCEIIPRVHFVIADKFPASSVKLVGSGAKHQADHRSTTAVFRTHGILFHAKFLDGIGRRLNDNGAVAKFVIVHSVEQEVVVKDAQTIHGKRSPGPVIVGRACSGAGPGRTFVSSWSKKGKLEEIPAVQWQVNNALFGFNGT